MRNRRTLSSTSARARSQETKLISRWRVSKLIGISMLMSSQSTLVQHLTGLLIKPRKVHSIMLDGDGGFRSVQARALLRAAGHDVHDSVAPTSNNVISLHNPFPIHPHYNLWDLAAFFFELHQAVGAGQFILVSEDFCKFILWFPWTSTKQLEDSISHSLVSANDGKITVEGALNCLWPLLDPDAHSPEHLLESFLLRGQRPDHGHRAYYQSATTTDNRYIVGRFALSDAAEEFLQIEGVPGNSEGRLLSLNQLQSGLRRLAYLSKFGLPDDYTEQSQDSALVAIDASRRLISERIELAQRLLSKKLELDEVQFSESRPALQDSRRKAIASSSEYRSIVVGNKLFELSPGDANIVRTFAEAERDGILSLTNDELNKRMNRKDSKFQDRFNNKKIYKELFKPNNGHYRLKVRF